jgi:hypothetical protein
LRSNNENGKQNVDVRLTVRLALHLQFDLSANTLVIRAVQSPKCMVCILGSDVDCIYVEGNLVWCP